MFDNPDVQSRFQEAGLTFLALFASSGTLVCCALPIALVTLGMGAAVVGLTSAAPWLITLTHYKAWLFAGSGLLLGLGGYLLYRPGRSCPVDPKLGALCERLDRWNHRIYWGSVSIWGIGVFAAYLLLPIRQALGF